jgi:hypothetical protein
MPGTRIYALRHRRPSAATVNIPLPLDRRWISMAAAVDLLMRIRLEDGEVIEVMLSTNNMPTGVRRPEIWTPLMIRSLHQHGLTAPIRPGAAIPV